MFFGTHIRALATQNRFQPSIIIPAYERHSMAEPRLFGQSCTVTAFAALGLLLTLLTSAISRADEIFIHDTLIESGVTLPQAQAADDFIRQAVTNRPADHLAPSAAQAAVTLQPRLLKLGDTFLLTIEKSIRGEIVYVAQTKFPQINELDQAANRTVMTVLAEPLASYQNGGTRRYPSAPYSEQQGGAPTYDRSAKSSAAIVKPLSNSERGQGLDRANSQAVAQPTSPAVGTSSPRVADQPTEDMTRSSEQVEQVTQKFPDRKPDRWTLGLGPMFSHNMQNDQVMYGLMAGHIWDLNPFLSPKVIVEANFSSAKEAGQYYNVAVGANYYFVNHIENAPYVSADLGYGYAYSIPAGMAEGFSLGASVGWELLRTSSNPLDLSLHFSTIVSGMSRGSGDPSLIGARVAISL